MNPIEDFPAPFTSKHLKGRTKHSSAKYSASETKPLIPTEENENDSGHKHIALVLSSPQHDELNQTGALFVGNGSDIPLTIMPAYSSLVSRVTNRSASNLQKSASSSDLKAAVCNVDTGSSPTQDDCKSLNYVQDHTSNRLPPHVSPELDRGHCNIRPTAGVEPMHFRTHRAGSVMEAPEISTSQSENCQEDAPLSMISDLPADYSTTHFPSIADPCQSLVTPNRSTEIKNDHITSAISSLSDGVTCYSSPLQDDESTCLLGSSCSSDGNKRSTAALRSPSKDTVGNAGHFYCLSTPEAANVRDQSAVSLLPEVKEPVKIFVPGTSVTCEAPNQIYSTGTENSVSVSDHNKSCISSTGSQCLHYPHSGSLHLNHNTSPTHQMDRHSPSTTSKEETAPHNRIPGVSYACHVKADADVYHTSVGAFPDNITHQVKPGCMYPSISDNLDVCFCGNSFKIHYPQLLTIHGSDPLSPRDNDCPIFLSENPQSSDGYKEICSTNFVPTAPYSNRFIHSPVCGCGGTDTLNTQHSQLEDLKILTHSTKSSNETHQLKHTDSNSSCSNSSHTSGHPVHCNATPTSRGPYSLHSCAVNMFNLPVPSSDTAPSRKNYCACTSTKTTNVQAAHSGPICHCDQHLCMRTPGENSINNIPMANSVFYPEIRPGSNMAGFDANNILESQEHFAGCKGDNERNSMLSNNDGGHHFNKEGSLARSNTSEVGLLKVCGNAFSDRDVPNYSILCIIATVLNPVFGLAALLCHHYAQINFRLHRRAKANNLYFATIIISTVAIFFALVGAVLLVTHIAVVHSEAKLAATTPSTDQCESKLFGYDESLKTFFNIDFQLYCEIIKNEKIMDALKRFWLEDIHNVNRYGNIESNSKGCNNTQNGRCGDASSANDTFPEETSLGTKDSFGNLQTSEDQKNSEGSATVGYTPQLSKPSEHSGYSHNTILSSNDGPVVPPELEEEYRQFLEGHTRTKVGIGHPILQPPTADQNLPAQTPPTTDDISTTDTTSGYNATET